MKNKLLNNILLFFPCLILANELLLRLFTNASLGHNLFTVILLSLAYGAVINIFILLVRKDKQWITTALSMFVLSIFYISEILTKRTFQVYMPLSDLLQRSQGVFTDFRSDLIHSISGGLGVILIYFIPIILCIYYRKYITYTNTKKGIRTLLYLLVPCFLLGLSLAKNGEYSNTYNEQYSFNQSMEDFGLMTTLHLETKSYSNSMIIHDSTTENSTVSDLYNVMEIDFDTLIKEESDETLLNLDQYVASLTPSNKNDYTGIFKGKNLVMICAEAFSDAVVDPNLTPTLYRMVHNGFYFSDYYQPSWGGSTSTGEYSFLTGLVPCDLTDTMMYTIGHNMYFTLGNQLQRKDYYSGAYHNSSYDYYNRDQTHMNLGYDYYLGQGNGLEEVTGNWPNDEKMLSLTLDSYVNYQPFSMYYMTLNGHCAYNDPEDWRVKEHLDTILAYYGDKYPDYVNYYLCYQMELEEALTTFLQKLEDYGIADQTVIVLTSDHYPYGLDVSTTFGNEVNYCFDLYGEEYSTPWGKDHNTLIIYSTCLENELSNYACEISSPTYSLDIVPTLSNLFGLEYDSRLLVGRDVFSTAEALVLWNNYSWKTELGTYDGPSKTFTPLEGAIIEEGYVERINEVVYNKINYSRQVLYNDYYGYLFGEDPLTYNNENYFNAQNQEESEIGS